MRVITAVGTAAAAGVVIVTSWQAGQRPGPSAASGVHVVQGPPAVTPSKPPVGSGRSGSRTTSGSGARAATTRRTVTGALVQTQYGTVQVSVTLVGRRIVQVTALHLTNSSQTSVAISAGAEPTLHREALSAQSAHIDLVSGATYTSEGYKASLQAALDAAHR